MGVYVQPLFWSTCYSPDIISIELWKATPPTLDHILSFSRHHSKMIIARESHWATRGTCSKLSRHCLNSKIWAEEGVIQLSKFERYYFWTVSKISKIMFSYKNLIFFFHPLIKSSTYLSKGKLRYISISKTYCLAYFKASVFAITPKMFPCNETF